MTHPSFREKNLGIEGGSIPGTRLCALGAKAGTKWVTAQVTGTWVRPATCASHLPGSVQTRQDLSLPLVAGIQVVAVSIPHCSEITTYPFYPRLLLVPNLLMLLLGGGGGDSLTVFLADLELAVKPGWP